MLSFERHPDHTIGAGDAGAATCRHLVRNAFFSAPVRRLRVSQTSGLAIPLGGPAAVRRRSGAIFEALCVQQHAFGMSPASALREELHRTFGILRNSLPP